MVVDTQTEDGITLEKDESHSTSFDVEGYSDDGSITVTDISSDSTLNDITTPWNDSYVDEVIDEGEIWSKTRTITTKNSDDVQIEDYDETFSVTCTDITEFNNDWNLNYIYLSQTASLMESTDIYISPDGYKLYVSLSEDGSDNIYEYDLGTAWDISTLSFVQSADLGSLEYCKTVCLSDDGTKLYIADGLSSHKLEQFTLSIAWDISTATLDHSITVGDYEEYPENGITSVYINEDGTKLVSGSSNGELYKTILSTAYDITSPSSYQIEYLEDSSIDSVWVDDTGTHVYYTYSTDYIIHSTMDSWDINSMSESEKIDSNNGYTYGIFMKEGGGGLYEADFVNDDLYFYEFENKYTATYDFTYELNMRIVHIDSVNGSDSYSGARWETAWHLLSTGAERVLDGEELQIASGDYRENLDTVPQISPVNADTTGIEYRILDHNSKGHIKFWCGIQKEHEIYSFVFEDWGTYYRYFYEAPDYTYYDRSLNEQTGISGMQWIHGYTDSMCNFIGSNEYVEDSNADGELVPVLMDTNEEFEFNEIGESKLFYDGWNVKVKDASDGSAWVEIWSDSYGSTDEVLNDGETLYNLFKPRDSDDNISDNEIPNFVLHLKSSLVMDDYIEVIIDGIFQTGNTYVKDTGVDVSYG